MLKKNLIAGLICLLSFVNAGAQMFTKEQMLEDFDFLYGKLDSVNTRFPVVEKVTGTDIPADIRKVRKSLDTVTCNAGFYDCLYRAIMLCKDQHISFSLGYPYNDYDSSFVRQAVENSISFVRSSTRWKYEPRMKPVEVYYMDGKYYSAEIMCLDDSSTLIPAKANLLKINGLPINKYVEKWVVPVFYPVRWDPAGKRFYVGGLLSPDRVGQSDQFVVTYAYKGAVKEVDLNRYRYRMRNFGNGNGVKSPKVLYFDRDRILYVRIPAMNPDDIENYKTELSKYKEEEIDKIVIDVRGNGGGSDWVWLAIVSAIVDKPVPYPQTLAFRDNGLVKAYLAKNDITYKEEQIDEKPLVIGKNTYLCMHDDTVIQPSESSLKYDGNVYVLIDDRIYSSTLAFTAVCQHSDQFITVGTPSGYFGGQGVRPLYFIMPNSKLIFRVEYSLDCTGVDKNNFEGYYHDTPEISLLLTLDDIFNAAEYTGEMYSEDFLYDFDPVFRKVLELPD